MGPSQSACHRGIRRSGVDSHIPPFHTASARTRTARCAGARTFPMDRWIP